MSIAAELYARAYLALHRKPEWWAEILCGALLAGSWVAYRAEMVFKREKGHDR